MAKSLARIRPGVISRSAGLIQAAINQICLDQALKGDDDPISINDLIELTHQPYASVVSALEEVSSLMLVKLPPGAASWAEVGAFRIGSISLATVMAHTSDEDEDGQQLINFEEAAPIHRTREQALYQEIERDKVIYRIEVTPVYQGENSDGLLYVDYVITAKDKGRGKKPTIEKVRDKAETVHAAFAFWDEWMRAYEPGQDESKPIWMDRERIVSWAKGLRANGDGLTVLSAFAYDAVLLAFGSCDGYTVEVRPNEAKFMVVGREFGVADIGGYELPGQPDPSPVPELEEKPEEVLTAEFVLEDGTPISVTAKPKGRGIYTVEFLGEISETKEKVKDIRKALMKPDFPKWAEGFAEIARKTFLGSRA